MVIDGVVVGLGLVCFVVLIWGAWLTIKLNDFDRALEGFESSFGDIEQGLAIIGSVMKQIPDMMPSFHLPQENPLQTLVSMWVNNVKKSNDNITKPARDTEGRFTHGSEIAEKTTEATQ